MRAIERVTLLEEGGVNGEEGGGQGRDRERVMRMSIGGEGGVHFLR